MPRLSRVVALTLALGALAACAESPTSGRFDPSFLISDGAHMHGNPHFYFLPPMVPQPATSGTPNGSLSPTVTVCEFTTTCVATIARFTMTSGTASEVVRFDAASGSYIVNWHTDQCITGACTLDPAKTYRIRILVGLVELGFADVDVVSNGSQLKNVQTDQYIGLVDGRTLPIKFRIEQGALAVVGTGGSVSVDASGALVASGAGVALAIPPGALSGAVDVSVATVTNPPAGSVAPVVDLGPSGTTFAQPVTLTIGYDPAQLPAGVPDTALTVIYLRDGSWDVVPGSAVNPFDHTVSAPITHFSGYSIGLSPTNAAWVSQPTSIAVGQTTTLTASLWYQNCSPFGCSSYPLTNWWMYWRSTDLTRATLVSASTHTDANGYASSTWVGAAVGFADETAGDYPDGVHFLSSNPVRLTVVPSLSLFVVGDPFSGPRSDTFRSTGINEAFPLFIKIPSAIATDVPVSIHHSSPSVAGSNPSATIHAGNTSEGTSIGGLSRGIDTVIVSAPNYGPDTVVVSVDTGLTQLSGWPSTLAVGESAAVQVRPVNPANTIIDNAYGTTFALAVSPNLRLSDGHHAISAVPVPDGTSRSATFYVVALNNGTGQLTVSNPVFHMVVSTLSITGQPPSINPSPTSVTINVAQGSVGQATINIANGGGGTLSGLFAGPFSDEFSGGVYPWIKASFSSTTAPSVLTITAAPPSFQPVQQYQMRFDVVAPGANPQSFTFYSIYVNVLPAAVTAEAMAGGKSSCEKQLSGLVYCWGETSFGATNAPGGAFQTISGGFFHYCGIRPDQSLTCWGYDSDLRAEPPSGSFKQLSVGPEDACALRTDGTPACWGFTNDGRASIPGGSYAQISMGWYHGCAIHNDGSPVCWGRNDIGQATPPAGELFNQVTGGVNSTCGVHLDLTLACWGAIGTPPAGDFIAIGHNVGGGHMCAIRTDRTLACWGQNDFGQANPPAGQFVQVSEGALHSCGIRVDGTPICWGSNGTGAVVIPPPNPYSATDLGTGPGAAWAEAREVNSGGRVAGWGGNAFANWQGWAWDPGSSAITNAGNPCGDWYMANGVNAAGTIAMNSAYCGYLFDPGPGLSGGTITSVPAPGGTNRNAALSVNDQGLVLACADNGSFAYNYIWDRNANTFTIVPSGPANHCRGKLNNAGQAIVNGEQGGAYLWDIASNTLTALPGGPSGTRTYGMDLNDQGVVVGRSCQLDDVTCNAWRWTVGQAQLEDLGNLGGGTALAMGINSSGFIVGWSTTGGGAQHAYVWDPSTHTMTDLGAPSGFTQSVANSINDNGVIVGAAGQVPGIPGRFWNVDILQTGVAHGVEWTKNP